VLSCVDLNGFRARVCWDKMLLLARAQHHVFTFIKPADIVAAVVAAGSALSWHRCCNPRTCTRCCNAPPR
jgi:hypothetical protein